MRTLSRRLTVLCLLSSMALAASGCGGGVTALVPVSYVRQPTKAIPQGLTTVAVLPAECGAATDAKWSDMTASLVHHLIQDGASRHGASLRIADRRETKKVFDEADMAAAGLINSGGNLGAPAKVLGVEAFVLSKVNIKVEKHSGRKRTIDGMSALSGWRYGGGSVSTSEVETVTRNMTVQTEFKLTDAKTGEVWFHWMPKTYRATEKTKASPFFGSSKTEAELTPRDQIVGTLVERGARDFVSLFLPCQVEYEVEVKCSGNEACTQGVKLLNADMYDDALAQFNMALREDPEDHRAAFGAGVSCEVLGRFSQALDHYKKACYLKARPEYIEAKKRMAANTSRT